MSSLKSTVCLIVLCVSVGSVAQINLCARLIAQEGMEKPDWASPKWWDIQAILKERRPLFVFEGEAGLAMVAPSDALAAIEFYESQLAKMSLKQVVDVLDYLVSQQRRTYGSISGQFDFRGNIRDLLINLGDQDHFGLTVRSENGSEAIERIKVTQNKSDGGKPVLVEVVNNHLTGIFFWESIFLQSPRSEDLFFVFNDTQETPGTRFKIMFVIAVRVLLHQLRMTDSANSSNDLSEELMIERPRDPKRFNGAVNNLAQTLQLGDSFPESRRFP